MPTTITAPDVFDNANSVNEVCFPAEAMPKKRAKDICSLTASSVRQYSRRRDTKEQNTKALKTTACYTTTRNANAKKANIRDTMEPN